MSKLTNTEIAYPNVDVLKVCDEHREIYLRFMGHIRHVPVSREEIKILSSIQFTADMTDNSDAYISNVLIDMGLRAPRLAFPNAFLDYADKALMRRGWDIGAPSKALEELSDTWLRDKPQTLGAFRHVHSVVEDTVLV